MYQYHLNSTAISVDLKGRLDIQAGNVVNISVKDLDQSKDKKDNNQLSGNYLVHTVKHAVDGGNLRTSLRLVKYNWDIRTEAEKKSEEST
jgi:hypothetical protein